MAWRLVVMVVLVLTALLVLAARDFLGDYRHYRVARLAVEQSHAIGHLVALGRDMIFERGQTRSMLLATESPTPQDVDSIRRLRTGMEENLRGAIVFMTPADGAGLLDKWNALQGLRQQVDRQWDLPLAQRDPALAGQWYAQASAFMAQVKTTAHRNAFSNADLPPAFRLANRVVFASLALRENLGEEASAIGALAVLGGTLSDKQERDLIALRGRVELQIELITADLTVIGDRDMADGFQHLVTLLRGAVWPFQDQLLAAAKTGKSQKVGVAAYGERVRPVIHGITDLTAKTQAHAEAVSLDLSEAAYRDMVVSVLVCVAILAFAGGTLLTLHRRLILPLRVASQEMRDLIADHGRWGLMSLPEGDEIDEMHAVLTSFRGVLADRMALWQALPDLIVYKDAEGRWQTVNSQACVTLQVTPEGVAGKTDAQVAESYPYLQPWLSAAQSGDALMWRNEMPLTREEVLTTVEGDAVFLQVVRIPLFHPDGSRRGVVVVGRDVTDRRRAEAATARLSRQHQLILECAGEGITGVDAQGRTIFFNHAASRMTGWTNDEIVGKPQHAVLHHSRLDGSPYPNQDCPVAKTLADGVARHAVQETFWTKDGQPLAVEFSVTPLVEQERVLGAVVVFHDIGTRLAAEQEIQVLLEELQRSNRELERFAYVASHDLRQPLRMITGYMSLLQKRLGESLTDENASFFSFASDGAKRMDRMIRDLLDYSRIGRGHDKESVDLNQVAAQAVENLKPVIAENAAVVSVATGLPVVIAVRSEMERLIQNLVGNALKFHAPDRPPRVELGCRDDGKNWVLWVRDNGIGIDPKDHDRLFAIFQRLVPQDRYDGTGIGLASVRKIAENHGGRVWVESELGQGATFLVALPKL